MGFGVLWSRNPYLIKMQAERFDYFEGHFIATVHWEERDIIEG
jgi:hypothetical protein